jgi:hypothetical protein
LEIYIQWALDVLHKERPLPTGLWDWINDRGGFWLKNPSVEEQFDVLLRVLTGRSLKEEPQLWTRFLELRTARNSLAHKGAARLAGKLVDAGKARELVDNANKIIKWVESLLPEGLASAGLSRIEMASTIWPRDCPLGLACREGRMRRFDRRWSISSFFNTPRA